MKNLLTVSQNAWKELKKISKLNKESNFLLSTSSGGCNGFNYNFKICNSLNYNKVFNNNINIYIDPLSEMFLIGTKIDFINKDYSKNIFESKFTFIPSDKFYSCGCGKSFSEKN